MSLAGEITTTLFLEQLLAVETIEWGTLISAPLAKRGDGDGSVGGEGEAGGKERHISVLQGRVLVLTCPVSTVRVVLQCVLHCVVQCVGVC